MKYFIVKPDTAALSNFDATSDVFATFDAAMDSATRKAKDHRREYVILSVETVARAYVTTDEEGRNNV